MKNPYFIDNLINKITNPLLSNIIILDLKPNDEFKILLPESIPFQLSHLFNYSDLVKKFLNYKNSHHFIIITDNVSDLQTYANIKEIRAKVNGIAAQRFDTLSSFISGSSSNNSFISQISQEGDEKKIEIVHKKSISNKGSLKISSEELNYNQFNNLINSFIEAEYKHISFSFKGFKDIHKYCNKFNLKLINHSKETCVYCENNVIKKDSKQKKDDDTSFINKFTNFLGIGKSNRKRSLSSGDNNKQSDFPKLKHLASNESVFECLTVNMMMFRLEKITIYLYKKEFSLFLKINNKAFEPIELNIPLSSISKFKKMACGSIFKDFVVIDNKLVYSKGKKVKGKANESSLFINNQITCDIDVNSFIYPVLLKFYSIVNASVIELLIYFDNERVVNYFESKI